MSDRAEPTKGDFGWAALSGGRAVVPAEYIENRPYFGLEREAGYLWGTLRDEAGNPLAFMRRIPEPAAEGRTAAASSGSLPDRLLICAAWDGAEEMVLRKEARTAPPAGDIVRSLEGDRAVFRTGGEHPMELALSAKDASWTEEGLLQVSGPQVGPGLQWYLPGADAGIYYPTTTWQVAGTALGRPVQGFLFYEEAYVAPGGRLYVHHDPLLGDELHTTWYSWATRWDDGELEFGHFLFGHDRFSIAVIGNGDGDVRVPTTMTAKVTRSADGYWFDRIDYVLDGEEWELIPAPQGHMTGLGRVPNPQQEGLMRRKGETRRPVVWMAWGESVPHHGDERVVRRSLIGHP